MPASQDVRSSRTLRAIYFFNFSTIMADTKIQSYQTTKQEHERMKKAMDLLMKPNDEVESKECRIYRNEPRHGGKCLYFSAWVHLKDAGYASSDSVSTDRMAHCFAKAVNGMMPEILEKMIRISDKDLDQAKEEAEKEATELLKEIRNS